MKGIELKFPRLWIYDHAYRKQKQIWHSVHDEHGREYYWNIDTNETSWIMPSGDNVLELIKELENNTLFQKQQQQQNLEILTTGLSQQVL